MTCWASVVVVCCLCLISFSQAALTLSEKNFFKLPHERKEGFQDIKFSGSRVGTTEILVLTKSNGNAPADQVRNKAETRGGSWEKVAYGGNDDKAAEMWIRRVDTNNRNDLGQVDSSGGKGTLAVIVFEENLSVTASAGKIINTNAPCELNVPGSGEFLFAFGSDNGGSSSNADVQIDLGTDDPSFYYIRTTGAFRDSKLDSKRGGIAGIRLSRVGGGGAAPIPTPRPTPKLTPAPSSKSTGIRSISVVVAEDAEENNVGTSLVDSRDLEFGHDTDNGDSNQLVCMRFVGVAIPPGASVSSAVISFTGKPDASVGDSPRLTCFGDKSTNSARLTDAKFDLSSRTSTRAKVAWTPGFWADDEQTKSANLAPIVQEIVNTANWRSNNALTLCCKKQDGDTSTTKRRAYSTEGAGSAGDKPAIAVTFTDGSSSRSIGEEESASSGNGAVLAAACGAGLLVVGGLAMYIRRPRQSHPQQQVNLSYLL